MHVFNVADIQKWIVSLGLILLSFNFAVMKKDLNNIKKNTAMLLKDETPPDRDIAFCDDVAVSHFFFTRSVILKD